VTPIDFDFLCKLLKERSGLVLTHEKEYLVENRLMPVARRVGCVTIAELVQRLKAPVSDALKVEVTEAMMINESFFFRDKIPFDQFRDTILPELIEKRSNRRRIRIWSAAASTGQEAYSLAMLVASFSKLADWRIDIIATDISNEVLEKARAGLYSQFEVQRGLPIQMLMQHFEQVGEQWLISDKVRKMVQFRQINLLSDCSALGNYDVVFCRNVLIYFDHATKVDALERIRRQLAPDGFLILGAAETVVGLGEVFAPIPGKRALYRPKPKPLLVAAVKPVAAGARVA
jgi:chemotaxis protein methyltransferase CheR